MARTSHGCADASAASCSSRSSAGTPSSQPVPTRAPSWRSTSARSPPATARSNDGVSGRSVRRGVAIESATVHPYHARSLRAQATAQSDGDHRGRSTSRTRTPGARTGSTNPRWTTRWRGPLAREAAMPLGRRRHHLRAEPGGQQLQRDLPEAPGKARATNAPRTRGVRHAPKRTRAPPGQEAGSLLDPSRFGYSSLVGTICLAGVALPDGAPELRRR
jgi:hypothetical protein